MADMGLFYHIRIAIVFGLLILWSAVGAAGWWRAVIVIVIVSILSYSIYISPSVVVNKVQGKLALCDRNYI